MRGYFSEKESGRKEMSLFTSLFLSFECFPFLPLAFVTFTAYLYTCSLVRERWWYSVVLSAICLICQTISICISRFGKDSLFFEFFKCLCHVFNTSFFYSKNSVSKCYLCFKTLGSWFCSTFYFSSFSYARRTDGAGQNSGRNKKSLMDHSSGVKTGTGASPSLPSSSINLEAVDGHIKPCCNSSMVWFKMEVSGKLCIDKICLIR